MEMLELLISLNKAREAAGLEAYNPCQTGEQTLQNFLVDLCRCGIRFVHLEHTQESK